MTLYHFREHGRGKKERELWFTFSWEEGSDDYVVEFDRKLDLSLVDTDS